MSQSKLATVLFMPPPVQEGGKKYLLFLAIFQRRRSGEGTEESTFSICKQKFFFKI